MTSADPPPQTDPESPFQATESPKSPRRGVGRFLLPAVLVGLGLVGYWWLGDSGSPERPGQEQASRGDRVPVAEQRVAPDQARKAENQYQLGLLLAGQGKDDEAMLRFVEALQLNPRHPQAHTALGDLLQRRGRYGEAAEHLRQGLKTTPNNPQAHYFLGLCYSKQSQLAEAIEQFRSAVRLAPKFIPSRYNLGLALLLLGRNDDAIEEFEEALRVLAGMGPSAETSGFLALTHRGLADALFRRGKHDQALKHLEEALRANPNLGSAYSLRGEIASAQGRPDQAREDFRRALALDPRDERSRALLEALSGRPTSRKPEADQRGDQAPQQLITRLEERVGREPGNAVLRNDLGMMLAKTGQYERARQHLEEAVRLSPTQLPAHFNLAGVCWALGDLEQAEHYYRLAVQLDPSNAEAQRFLARFLYRSGRFAEAVEAVGSGLEHLPDNPLLLQELAWMLATCPAEQVREREKALAYALKLKGIWEGAGSPPQRGLRVLDVLAAAYAEADRFEEAVGAAERALALAGQVREERIAGQIEARLALYRQGQPYRETPPIQPADSGRGAPE